MAADAVPPENVGAMLKRLSASNRYPGKGRFVGCPHKIDEPRTLTERGGTE